MVTFLKKQSSHSLLGTRLKEATKGQLATNSPEKKNHQETLKDFHQPPPTVASGDEKLEVGQRIALSGICFAGYREYSEKTTQRAPPTST